MQYTDIGIDLGTASILVYIRGKGVVLKEPSVVAFDRDTEKIKAIGEDARLMLGRTPGNIVAVRPLRQGVISDYRVTEQMMKHFIQKALGRKTFRKPRIAVCVPSGVTEVEKKAVEDATYQAGARDVSIIEEPIAAAIGAGIDISKPCGNMIVDIGGGTSDIAVISLGGTVVSASIKVAGDDFDEAIVRYMRKKHNLLIGERTAEDIKIKIGSAFKRAEVDYMDVRGRNLVTGLPKTIRVSSEETEEALREATSQIIDTIHNVLERTPPELAADIADRGIVLTGGGSLLRGLEDLVESRTGINTMTAEDPMKVVAIGADISSNDVSVSDSLVENIEKDIPKLLDLGAKKAALTNVTGDDVVVSAFVEDDLLETVNEGLVNVLKKSAENLGDLSGISEKRRSDRYLCTERRCRQKARAV